MTPPPNALPPVTPSLEAPHGSFEHDGFYLRAGIGGGLLMAHFASDDSKDYGGSVRGSLLGGSLNFEFAIGGTPAPGLVLGGAMYLSGAGHPAKQTVKVDGQTVSPLPSQDMALFLLGPFVDYYINPKSGWHVQGALGLASVAVAKTNQSNDDARVRARQQGGFGFMIGGGYDLWVSPQWSFGGLLRMMYASTATNSSSDEHFVYQGLAFPELLFTATYH